MIDSSGKDYGTPYRIGSTRTTKTKDMDHLSRDACAALDAGMSYGKWKAANPHTCYDGKKPVKKQTARKTRVCPVCGEKFEVGANQTNKLYCSEQCRIKANTEKKKRVKRNRRTRKAVCVQCGADFMTDNAKRKYCSRECCKDAQREKKKRHAEMKEVKADG